MKTQQTEISEVNLVRMSTRYGISVKGRDEWNNHGCKDEVAVSNNSKDFNFIPDSSFVECL